MEKWIELIKECEDEIIDKGIEMYHEALNNPHLRFILEIRNNGNIFYWWDIAGGNTITRSSFEGKTIVLMEFCFRYEEDIEENNIEEFAYDYVCEKLNAKIEELKDIIKYTY